MHSQLNIQDGRDSLSTSVSLVIPTLNEADNLRLILPHLPSSISELVIVDGLSTDGTLDVVRSIRPDAVIIEEMRRGKGYALKAGFAACRGDIIVMMDADGSMAPAEIDLLVAALESGADMAKGSRYIQGGGSSDITMLRKAGNSALTHLVRATFGGNYSDLCYGYMAFWRDILPVIEGEVPGFEIETFLNVRALGAGLRVIEVPSYEGDRINGVSKLNTFRDGFRVLRTIFEERKQLQNSRKSLGSSQIGARHRASSLFPWESATAQSALVEPASDSASASASASTSDDRSLLQKAA